MRKVLPILLAIAIAAPALADVTVSVSDAGSETAQIALAIDGGAVVRGVALKVTITGAELAAIADVTDVMAAFNAYIDYYYSNPGFLGGLADETALPGTGAHALADPDAAGVLATLPATTFVISLGALDNSGSQGGVAAGGVLANIKLSNFGGSTAQVCIEPDALRGGIVGDNLGTVSATACADIASAPQECVKSTAPFYAAWVQFGKPNCWCYKKQCRGDVDGASQLGRPVSNNDLTKFKEAFNKTDAQLQAVVNGICADLDHAAQLGRRVSNNDLQTFKLYFNKADANVPICEMDNYNFWTN